MAYKISKDNQDLVEGVPVTIGRRPANFFLGLSVHLAPGHAEEQLMVAQ